MPIWLFKTTYNLLSTISDPVSFHLVYEVPEAADSGHWGDKIMANWHTPGSGATQAPEWYLSSEVNGASGEVSVGVYDITAHLDGSPHGSPIHVSVGTRFTGPDLSGNNLPTGCAAVVSYRADYGSDVEFGTHARPRARDRNRFYYGPLDSAARAFESSTNRPELSTQFMTDMLLWLTTVAAAVDVDGFFGNLRVWSRKNAAVKAPLTSWMDNRIDYQRRRADQGVFRQVTPFP